MVYSASHREESRAAAESASLAAQSNLVVVPLALVLAALYLVLAGTHPFFVPQGGRWIMSGTALGSSIIAAVTARWWRVSGCPEYAHRAVAGLTLLALANSAVHLVVDPVPVHTGNLILVLMAFGLVALSRPWFYAVLTGGGATWLVVVIERPIADPEQWGWFLLFAGFVSVLLFEQRYRATVQAAAREHDLARSAQLLQDLVTAPELARGDIDAMFRKVTEAAAEVMAIRRVGVWLFEEAGSQMRLADLYDAQPGVHTSQQVIYRHEYPDYFAALDADRAIATADASVDPRTECLQPYLQAYGITAMLDAPILIRGEVSGVLCHEHCGESRVWAIEEETLAASLAEIAALAVQSQERAQLERQVMEAQRLERMGILAGGVAHDFNNLLTVVLGNTELLLMGAGDDPGITKKLESTRAAAERAAELARQMLAYSGRATFIKARADLRDLAEELITGWGQSLPGGITLANELASQAASVEIDATQIRQVLLNLLTNALDSGATHIDVRGGTVMLGRSDIHRCVAQDGVEPGCFAWIEIADNGRGMAEDVVEQMFEPFYTTKSGGRGLGLAAAIGIMRAHRGTILVRSEVGEGSHIRLMLPLVDVVEVAAAGEHAQRGAYADRADVLVIEDQTLVRDLVCQMLGASGHSVCSVGGIAELRALLESPDAARPALAVVDLTLADGDGVEAVKILRNIVAELPVILMSGYDGKEALTRFTDPGRLRFLQKPFDRAALDTAMAEVLEG